MAARVLVVDDDAGLLRALLRLLRRIDPSCEIEPCEDAMRARQCAADRAFDLALLDLHIGTESGADLGLALRERIPGLPIVFITGEPSSENVARARTLNPLAVLDKPVDPVRLAAIIGPTLWR